METLRGSYVTVCEEITNTGTIAAQSFAIRMYLDGNKIAPDQKSTGLLAKYSQTVCHALNWPRDNNAHSIKVAVDVGNTVDEFSEKNNELSKQFPVGTIAGANTRVPASVNVAITSILLRSSPTHECVLLVAHDMRIATVRLEIYNLLGSQVFDSGEVQCNSLTWSLRINSSEPIANGVYLYIVRWRDFIGREYGSELRKIVILR